MTKIITVNTKEFVDGTPLRIRPKLVSFVYSMADHHGWQIRVAGQHWSDGSNTTSKHSAHTEHGISDAQWATLMGYKPS